MNIPASTARKRGDAGLSIIVPCFNEADNLPALHARLCETAEKLRDARGLRVEVVYVDDGSRDNTYAVASALPAILNSLPPFCAPPPALI